MDTTFSNQCRACAGRHDDSKKMVSLFERNVSEMFSQCSSLEIASDDSLPSHICFECFGQLTNFNKFRQDCVNSDIFFRDLLATEPIKVEPFDDIAVKCEESERSQVFEVNATGFMDECFTKCDPELIPPASIDVPDPIDHLNPFDNTKYICDYCGNGFDRKNELGSHMTKHKREMLLEPRPKHIPCPIAGCRKVFAAKKNLNSHRVKVHNVKLERRIKIVEKKVKYCCTKCPKWFGVQHRLDAHVRSMHEGLKPYSCTQCDREFCKYRTFIDHIRLMHGTVDNEKYKCSYDGCDKEFTVKCTLTRHIERIHLGKYVISTSTRKFICEQCGKSFKTTFSLRKHSYSHSGVRPFACKVCPKGFTSNDKLKIHTMRHFNIKPFECTICGARRTTQKELKDHLNFHSKEISYPCKECPRVFTSYGAVNRHVRVHHRNHRPYVCPHCQRAFAKAEVLKYHIMTHTGEKPCVCSVCGHRFIQAVALKAHMKVHDKTLTCEAEDNV